MIGFGILIFMNLPYEMLRFKSGISTRFNLIGLISFRLPVVLNQPVLTNRTTREEPRHLGRYHTLSTCLEIWPHPK